MATLSDNAICIRQWDFSETSQTVALLLREHGLLRGLAKGAKRAKGPFSGGLDVLTRGHVVMLTKPSRGLAIITEWRLQETFRPVRRSLAANRAGLYMADLALHLLHEEDPHPVLFDALVDGLRGLEDVSAVGKVLLRYQWIALEQAGYQPRLEGASPGSGEEDDADHDSGAVLGFSPSEGGIIANSEAPGAWRLRGSTVELLARAARGELPADEDPTQLDRANRLLAAYAREILGRELPTMRWARLDGPSAEPT